MCGTNSVTQKTVVLMIASPEVLDVFQSLHNAHLTLTGLIGTTHLGNTVNVAPSSCIGPLDK
jgi:hypothetical protein